LKDELAVPKEEVLNTVRPDECGKEDEKIWLRVGQTVKEVKPEATQSKFKILDISGRSGTATARCNET
jgi:hypothetical protein